MCSNGARLQNVSQAPGGKEGTEFRSNMTHPLLPPLLGWNALPHETPALKLAAVNVVTF